MAQKISAGIDRGSQTVKVAVVESVSDSTNDLPKIIGFGIANTEGVRHGYVVDPEEVAKSIRKAVDQAQKNSGYKIDKAYFSIGGADLEGAICSHTKVLGEDETTISAEDISDALEECQENLPGSTIRNRHVIHGIPLSYKIDGKQVYGKPVGMVGTSIDVKAFFITSLTQNLENLISAAKLASIEVADVDASAVAASIPLISKSQLMAGCGLLVIGSETSSFAIFENGVPVSYAIFPIGSKDVTNDIALGFKVSLEEAERIKTSRPESLPYPRRKIEEIIRARLEDIFDLVQGHLKKAGRAGLLPAGIFITGGGSQNPYAEEIAKNILKLPAKKVGIKFEGDTKASIPNAVWASAYGLATIGVSNAGSIAVSFGNKFGGLKTGIWRNIKRFFHKILP